MKNVNKMQVITLILFGGIFMLANTVSPVKKYTPYQIVIWELKANEGHEEWWYKDGFVKGRQAYSIGLGWNDQGSSDRRREIKKYTSDGKVTLDEAVQITIYELNKYGKLHDDPLKNAALKLYSYNCGLTKSGNRLGKCCNAYKGCGSNNSNVRKSHNRRRKFELALWRHDYGLIQKYCDENRLKVITMMKN